MIFAGEGILKRMILHFVLVFKKVYRYACKLVRTYVIHWYSDNPKRFLSCLGGGGGGVDDVCGVQGNIRHIQTALIDILYNIYILDEKVRNVWATGFYSVCFYNYNKSIYHFCCMSLLNQLKRLILYNLQTTLKCPTYSTIHILLLPYSIISTNTWTWGWGATAWRRPGVLPRPSAGHPRGSGGWACGRPRLRGWAAPRPWSWRLVLLSSLWSPRLSLGMLRLSAS